MRYNVPRICATRVCRACADLTICVAVMYLTLRTGCERYGRKNPLPYSFSERSHVGNLRQAIQGKGRSSKRKENRRLSFLFAHRRGYGVVPAAGAATLPPSADGESPAESQRQTSRPLGANTLTQFEHPGQPVQKRSRPVRANLLTQFAHPGFPVQKRSRPVRANPLPQFVCPGQPVQKTSLVFKLNCFFDNATAKRHTQAETA